MADQDDTKYIKERLEQELTCIIMIERRLGVDRNTAAIFSMLWNIDLRLSGPGRDDEDDKPWL